MSHTFSQGSDRFYNEIRGAEILTGNSFLVSDDRFQDESWKEISKTRSVDGYISLEVNDDAHILSKEAFICQVSVRVDMWNAGNDSTAVFKDLSITYDPAGQSSFSARDEFHFKDAHEFRVTILNIKTIARDDAAKTVEVLPILKMTGYLEVSRSLMFNCTDDTQFSFYFVNPTTDRMQWLWNPIPGADEYDLEWTFYDAESEWGKRIANGPVLNLASYEEIFKNNSTRVITSFFGYELPLVFPDGYLFYRVRGVKYEDGLRQTSNWSHSGGGSLAAFADKYEIDIAHEANLNWQSSTTFAEDAKNAQMVAYADGMPRSRQEVTLSRADDLIIVKEQVYDLLGRPAIQVMPSPVDNGGSTYNNRIGYVPDFSRDHNGGEYTAADFDGGTGCQISNAFPAMHEGFGAAKYYSPNNILANAPILQSIQRFIPDADGYPFAVTEYTPDATGRIKRQGGVGRDFQINAGEHSTRYFYGKASQNELNRLFELNDVGTAVHYQKNMVQDPNGQFSVSYIDPSGRTIATALAGDVPQNLDELLPHVETEVVPTNLLNNVLQDATLSSTYVLTVSESGNYEFDYDMSTEGYKERCLNPNSNPNPNPEEEVCLDCIYDLTIRVTDNCSGVLLEEVKERNMTLPTPSHMCNVMTPGFDQSFELNLQPGEYTITKTLTVSRDAVEYFAQQYMLTACMPDLVDITNEFIGQINCEEYTCEECEEIQKNNPALYAVIQTECEAICEGASSYCDIFYQTLLADVSFGGQYFVTGINANGDEDCTAVVEDNTSIFYSNNGAITPPYQLPDPEYKDEFGIPSVIVIDGVEFRPEELNICDFINYWQPSWAKSLVQYHPEYCLYTACHAQEYSEDYNVTLENADNFPAGLDAGVFNNDPYFQPGGAGAADAAAMSSWLFNIDGDMNPGPSLLDVLVSVVACPDTKDVPCQTGYAGLCTTDQLAVWELFRSAYLGRKYEYFVDNIYYGNCTTCPCINCIEVVLLKSPEQANVPLCPDCDLEVCPSYLNDKKLRWLRIKPQFFPDGTPQEMVDWYGNHADIAVPAMCEDNCKFTVDAWMEELLKLDCMIPHQNNNVLLGLLRDKLENICMRACESDPEKYPYGATDFPEDPHDPDDPADSIMEALEQVLNMSPNPCDDACTDYQITFPGTYAHPYQTMTGGMLTVFNKYDEKICDENSNSSLCENLAAYQTCWNNSSAGIQNGFLINGITINNFLDFINYFSDVKLTQEELDALAASCGDTDCHTYPDGLKIPPQLACSRCRTGPEVRTARNMFLGMCPTGTNELRQAYMNHKLGLNYTYQEYDLFLALYNSIPEPCVPLIVLCPKQAVEQLPEEDCQSEQVEIMTLAALDAYNAQVAAFVEQFKKNYLAHCLDAMKVTETFRTNARIREHQYTLYYYDRAGHLVQTVPPKGVMVGSPDQHKMATTYRYDCFGNAVERITPDGGKTLTWYDFLGRPVVSQDARQRNPGPDMDPLYSYTMYDGLGRPIETGEKTLGAMGPMDNNIARDPDLLIDWILEDASVALKDITRTYYDETPMDWADIHVSGGVQPSLIDYAPTDLRKRVSTVVFLESYEPPLTGNQKLNAHFYEYATHYSYDIAGNVKTLVQDIRRMGDSGANRYKRIDYNYDIISGKVNRVDYQTGAIDHFVHRYTYDANNRLRKTETSTKGWGLFWETDAEYEYYYHGPLGRTVTGERKVQGTDYAYTLQGWIKGVNASAMDAFSDNGNIPEFLYIHDEDIPSGTYQARTAIISHGRVQAGRNVTFKAGKYITLEKGGFRADLGSEFLAIIEPALDTDPTDIVDMGRDGALTDPHPGYIARDAFSYTLGYFDGDYQRVSNNTIPDFEISRNYGSFYNAAPDLFNGNIRHIAQQAKTLTASAFNYGYDQLNRLGNMTYWNRPNMGTWGPSTAYKETVEYDRNGNIKKYTRSAADENGATYQLDDLTYHYSDLTKNLLNYVEEDAPSSAFDGDIEDQSANTNNYEYDDAGNLWKDHSAGPGAVRTFRWSMYGKLQGITGYPGNRSIIYGYDAMQKRVMKINQQIVTQGVPPKDFVIQTRTFYIRDAQGNNLATYEQTNDNTLTLKDLELYGSARLGVFHADLLMFDESQGDLPDSIGTDYLGRKEYELTNHLGNVIAVVRDEADWVDNGNDPGYFEPRVSSAREYYPFGMLMPNRKSPSYLNTSYRYGFNGKESDDDAGYGDDGFQDYGMRMYMPGLGRFISVDPIADEYPWYTPYQFAGNMPIMYIDLDGLEPEEPPLSSQSATQDVLDPVKINGLNSQDGHQELSLEGKLNGAIIQFEKEPNSAKGQGSVVIVFNAGIHDVQQGEGLWSIANQYGYSSHEELSFYRYNGEVLENVTSESMLHPGDQIYFVKGDRFPAQGRIDPVDDPFTGLFASSIRYLASNGVKNYLTKKLAGNFKTGGSTGIKLRNGKLAGSVHPKTGVPFNKQGFPDFSKHLYKGGKNDVKITPTGNRPDDFAAANKAAGYTSTPKGFTWHHHQTKGRMQLVESDIHAKTGHTGGFSLW